MFDCSVSSQGALSLVRPNLSLVSVTSFCLEFCFEDDQNPSWGLIS